MQDINKHKALGKVISVGRKKSIIKKPRILFVVCVAILILFIQQLAGIVTAAVDPGGGGGAATPIDPATYVTVEKRARAWTAYSVIVASSECDLATEISGENVTAGHIFGDPDETKTINVGMHVDGQDGDMQCNNTEESAVWLLSVLNDWDIPTYGDFLSRIDYTFDGENWNGKGDAAATRQNVFSKVVPTNYRLTQNEPGPQDVLYHIWYTAFISPNGCRAEKLIDKDSAEWNNLTSGQKADYESTPDKTVTLPYIDLTTGDKYDHYLYSYEERTTGIHLGMGGNPPGRGNNPNCNEIAEALALTDYFNTFYNSVKAQLLAGLGYNSDVNLPNGGGAAAGVTDSCTAAANQLTWILCPILKGVDSVIGFAKGIVERTLIVEPWQYGENKDGTTNPVNPVKKVWSTFRNIATILLVGIALFIIISQIIGFEFLSAYTVKKAVPKLVTAVILIQLSWVLITGAIALTNIIGLGVRDLLYGAFSLQVGQDNIWSILLTAMTGSSGTETSLLAILSISLVAGAVMSIGLIITFITLLVGAAISMGTVMAVLVFRQILLIALLVVAPLAIVLWILPNTQKTYKMWSSNLAKLLMMFPLVMGFLAIGACFAKLTASGVGVASGQSSTENIIGLIIVIVAYFAPFFMIPKTFKMGGSLMASVAKGVDSARSKAKKGIMESAPVKNLKESHLYNKKATGQDRAAYSNNRLMQAYGRWQAGTTGRYGRAGRQTRADEKAKATQNAAFEIRSDFSEAEMPEGSVLRHLSDYSNQNEYTAALAAGHQTARISRRNAHGEHLTDGAGNLIYDEIQVRGHNSVSKQISAATSLVDRGESDYLRAAWQHMNVNVRAGVNDTHGSKIAEIANDLTGRSSWSIGEKQLATQDDETLRNWAAEYDEIIGQYALTGNATDLHHANTMEAAAQRATAAGSAITLSSSQRRHLVWVAGGGVGDRPQDDQDYAGRQAAAPAAGIPGTPGFHPGRAADDPGYNAALHQIKDPNGVPVI